MTPFEQRVISDAVANLGVHEDGDGNRGKYVDAYLKFVGLPPGNPWCAAFACYRLAAAAEELNLDLDLPKTGSSSALYRWFKERDLLLPAPTPGCIGMVKGGVTGHRHTFLVEKIRSPIVVSIDANESNRVLRSAHRIQDCDWGRVKS